VNRERVMMEMRCFICGGFGHMACNCRNRREERSTQMLSNKFEVLTSRVMNMGIPSGGEVRKMERKKLLKKVTVKIGLKQKDDKEGIIVEVLLDSGAIGLVMSSGFVRKNKLERLIYIRNVDGLFNYEGPIEYIVEVELFFNEKQR